MPGGQVRVRGELCNGRFTLRWQERGGPPAREPERFGFGSRLMDVSVQHQLGGELVRTWRPEGLEVRLSAPAENIAACASPLQASPP